MDKKIKIVLADDHVLVRNGIKAMLEHDADLSVTGEAGNGSEALEVARAVKPDLLILDIRMPEMTGLEAAAKLKSYSPKTKAVILSMHDSEEEFVKALNQIHGGTKYFSGSVSNVLANRLLGKKPLSKSSTTVDSYNLSKREKEILRMVVDGKQNKQIADLLDKSVRTIETHRFNIMKKLEVNNAIDMVNKAMKENLV